MKLLFDENISHRILERLNKEFENSIHPQNDLEIWNFAKENKYAIVYFDEDFYEWMLLKSFPPKIVRLSSGNISTNAIAEIINNKSAEIRSFLGDEEIGINYLECPRCGRNYPNDFRFINYYQKLI